MSATIACCSKERETKLHKTHYHIIHHGLSLEGGEHAVQGRCCQGRWRRITRVKFIPHYLHRAPSRFQRMLRTIGSSSTHRTPPAKGGCVTRRTPFMPNAPAADRRRMCRRRATTRLKGIGGGPERHLRHTGRRAADRQENRLGTQPSDSRHVAQTHIFRAEASQRPKDDEDDRVSEIFCRVVSSFIVQQRRRWMVHRKSCKVGCSTFGSKYAAIVQLLPLKGAHI